MIEDKLADFFYDNIKNIYCECCDQNKWGTSPDILIWKGKREDKFAYYPYVLLECVNCGNTKFFNAIKIGIITQEEFINMEI